MIGMVPLLILFSVGFPVHEGLAAICVGCREKRAGEHGFMEGGRRGFINKKGEIVIPTIYEQAGSFEKGRAQVKIGGKWQLVDTNGEVLKAVPKSTHPPVWKF
jgi:hypothetical protein